jgi:hypothetical protein
VGGAGRELAEELIASTFPVDELSSSLFLFKSASFKSGGTEFSGLLEESESVCSCSKKERGSKELEEVVTAPRGRGAKRVEFAFLFSQQTRKK